jgi:hypothetical protein
VATSAATCRAVSGASPVIIAWYMAAWPSAPTTASVSLRARQEKATKPAKCSCDSAQSRGLDAASRTLAWSRIETQVSSSYQSSLTPAMRRR